MDEKIYYHAVNIATQSDYRKLRSLYDTHGSWERAWEFMGTRTAHQNAGLEDAWGTLASLGARLIFENEEEYPALLREIPSPPLALYVTGELPKRDILSLALVGTRKATQEGVALARQFAAELARGGATIVSGLAFGVDAAAHRGVLDAGGRTVAVLAHGLDRIYPGSHKELGARIVRERGALVSEYPPGTPTLPYRFLERNRIVSGLSRGVLIIEAPERSGALATARYAVEQNRDVFVVPGPARHRNFTGSHELIRSGATLVTRAAHVLESYGFTSLQPTTEISSSSTPEEKAVLHVLAREGEALPIDKIIELTNLKADVVNRAVSFLVVRGVLRETEDGYTVA